MIKKGGPQIRRSAPPAGLARVRFSTGANLKDFSGSFSGSFRLTYVVFPFVFNNFSASFLQITSFFVLRVLAAKCAFLCFQLLTVIK